MIGAVRLIDVLRRMQETRILVIADHETWVMNQRMIDDIRTIFGAQVIRMNYGELQVFFDQVDSDEAEGWKDRWIRKALKVVEPDGAWAGSPGGTILHTTDGGATWNVVPHPTTPITQVNRMDALGTNVWIADAATGGAVVHTQDGGLTWRAEYLPSDSPLTVHAFSPMFVWGSGSAIDLNPSFYRTVNGGDQWVNVITLGHDYLDDVCAATADDAWGVQNGGGVSGDIWRVHVAADGTPEARNVSPPELAGYMPGGVTCLDTRVAWVVA